MESSSEGTNPPLSEAVMYSNVFIHSVRILGFLESD